MTSNFAIRSSDQHRINPLWNLSERYLSPGKTRYKVVGFDRKRLMLMREESKLNKTATVLVGLTWALSPSTPLLAWGIRSAFRASHSFIEVIPVVHPRVDYPTTGSSLFDHWISKHFEVISGPSWMIPTTNDIILEVDDSVSADLEPYFADLRSFFVGHRRLLHVVNDSLNSIILNPTAENVQASHRLLKRVTLFFREFLRGNILFDQNFPHELYIVPPIGISKEELYSTKSLGAILGGYGAFVNQLLRILTYKNLLVENASKQQFSEHLTHLIKSLQRMRHHVLIHTKLAKFMGKVNALLSADEQLPESAFRHINLTWLHGSKAIVFEKALAQTEGDLLAFGKLAERNIQVFTGEQQNGITEGGINQVALSGVFVSSANIALHYAQSFLLNIEETSSICQKFIDADLSPLKYPEDIRDARENFQTVYRSFVKLKSTLPEEFESHREKLITQLSQITLTVEQVVKEASTYHHYYLFNFITILVKFNQLAHDISPSTKLSAEEIRLSNIPMVFGSHRVIGKPDRYSFSCDDEITHEEPLKLGHDIKVLFVKPENFEEIQWLVKAKGLDIQVEDCLHLQTLQKIHLLSLHYTFDILKLAQSSS